MTMISDAMTRWELADADSLKEIREPFEVLFQMAFINNS